MNEQNGGYQVPHNPQQNIQAWQGNPQSQTQSYGGVQQASPNLTYYQQPGYRQAPPATQNGSFVPQQGAPQGMPYVPPPYQYPTSKKKSSFIALVAGIALTVVGIILLPISIDSFKQNTPYAAHFKEYFFDFMKYSEFRPYYFLIFGSAALIAVGIIVAIVGIIKATRKR